MSFEAILNKKKQSNGSSRTCSLREAKEPEDVQRFDTVATIAKESFKDAGHDVTLSNNDVLIVSLSYIDAHKKAFAEHIVNTLKQ